MGSMQAHLDHADVVRQQHMCRELDRAAFFALLLLLGLGCCACGAENSGQSLLGLAADALCLIVLQ
jgi:hypothetical protein